MNLARDAALLFCSVSMIGCDPEHRHSPHRNEPDFAAISQEESFDLLKKLLEQQNREFEREMHYNKQFLSIENLLGGPPDLPQLQRNTLLTNALVISIDSEGNTRLREYIQGSTRVDVSEWLPGDLPAGEYLVGLLMPDGGWNGGSFGNPTFCVPLASDESFTYGFEGELTGTLEQFRRYTYPER